MLRKFFLEDTTFAGPSDADKVCIGVRKLYPADARFYLFIFGFYSGTLRDHRAIFDSTMSFKPTIFLKEDRKLPFLPEIKHQGYLVLAIAAVTLGWF